MKATPPPEGFDFDYLVIGSGFGGSVSALRLSEKGYRVGVLEMGKRYRTEDFPKTNWNLRKYLWLPRLKLFGIQALSLFRHVLVLHGSGVGGGSLVYANTLLVPGDSFFKSPAWSALADWKAELLPHYETARKMLGVVRNPHLAEADQKLLEVARELGREKTFHQTEVGVLIGKPGDEGKKVADPFFGGRGPERTYCSFCGGCMVGCREGAKNTLDKNYLFLAERNGVEIHAETRATKITPLEGGGYEVEVERSTAWFFKHRRRLRARGVVVAAGVLGTIRLLLNCRDVFRSLPKLSPLLGERVRTNSESLIGVTSLDRTKDHSKGLAIDAGFYPDDTTHIETVRYPSGSSFMRVLAGPMVDDGTHVTRPLKVLAALALHPVQTLKLVFNRRWAESTIILLVMQTLDNSIRLGLKRSWYTLFRRHLTTSTADNAVIPAFIPIANKVARMLAPKLKAVPQSSINETLLQIPATAHILGGCGIGGSAETGVVDRNQQAFGYRELYICDGSVVPANLGVNPSLTITAMTERCMSRIATKAVSTLTGSSK